jgi:hypothetical protein
LVARLHAAGLVTLAWVGLGSYPARAEAQEDPAYASLPAPAYEVYEAMLNYADDGAFARLGASLRHLDGLYRVLESCCGEPLKDHLVEALARADRAQVRARVTQLIAVDLRRHLAASRSVKDAARASQEVQMAAALYAILSPSVRLGDAGRDARIRHELKELLHPAGQPGGLSEPAPGDALLADLGASLPPCLPKSVPR